ncbi:MAG: hypothetical protein ACJ76Z_14470, partial [Thermoleophilaceae bacterium]
DIRAVDFDAALGTAAAVATAHARCRPSPGIVWSWGNRPSGLLVSRLKPYIVAKKGHLRLATFTGCA